MLVRLRLPVADSSASSLDAATRRSTVPLPGGAGACTVTWAESEALRAIVSEGASGRSVRDTRATPEHTWDSYIGMGLMTGATALFSGNLPPKSLRSYVPKISGATFFVYGEHGQPEERPANNAFYASATGPTELWEVPGSGHIGCVDARPLFL